MQFDAGPPRVTKDLQYFHAESENSGQSAWMHRLIWVFNGCIWNLVRNAVPQLQKGKGQIVKALIRLIAPDKVFFQA